MSESIHTPGPWTKEYFAATDQHDVASGPPDDASERYSVLEDLREADARLIAAAPDLLTASQAAVKKYDELYKDMDVDFAAFFTALRDEVAGLRAAIEKATPRAAS